MIARRITLYDIDQRAPIQYYNVQQCTYSIGIIPKRDRHCRIQYNPLPDIRKPDVPKRKRSYSGHCLADIHREFPITPVPVDVPTPGHLVRYYYCYYSQSDIILLFFIPKRTRRRHCDTHARTRIII